MTSASCRARWTRAVLAALTGVAVGVSVSCTATPTSRPAPPLPQVRAREIAAALEAGSYLPALQEIAFLRRTGAEAPGIDELESRALTALQEGFASAITTAAWADALRLLDSAAALGKPELAPGWTRPALLAELARKREAAGDAVTGIIARLEALRAGGDGESEVRESLAAAVAAGNRAAAASFAAALARRGIDAGVALPPAPSFAEMLQGSVTIWVNRGIRIEKGVGYPDRVIGSGFFIDRRGYLLTNHHVIESEVDPEYEGFSRLYLRLPDASPERIPAKVVGWDPVLDLALVKAEITPKFVFSGDATIDPAPGDRIFAIGSPAGLDQTLTSGIVSATGRRYLQVGEALQVDVPLNPGNSGGPLLTADGGLAGIVFAGLEQYEGLNFAIPWSWVERSLPLLYAGGEAKHPWLGMALAETKAGLEVLYTVAGEPADRAGILVGDLLTAVGGRPVATLEEAQVAILARASPSLAPITVSRGGSPLEVLVCLADRPAAPIALALKRDARDGVLFPLFGMRLERTGGSLGRVTYAVRRVIPGSVADEAGLSEGDPLVIQGWDVDEEQGVAIAQVVVRKRKAGFIESAVQVAAWLLTDNFI